MVINDIVKGLKDQVQAWRNRITGESEPVAPHPSQQILDLLDQLYHSSDFSRELDARCEKLMGEVEENIPKWPSLEYGDDYKLPILEHIENFANLLTTTEPQGAWSKPMMKAEMMGILRIDSYRKFKAFAKEYGLKQVGGNRQLWQIRIDRMDHTTRSKLN